MEFFEAHRFLMILRESIKLLPKNGKLMAFIVLFSILLSSSVSVLCTYSLQTLVQNMSLTIQKSLMPDPSSFNLPDPNSLDSTDPSSFTPQMDSNPAQMYTGLLAHLREDLGFIFALEIAFLLAISLISFFSTISTITVSALSYNDKNSSLKELISRIWTTWTRPFITSLYVSALAFGYFFAVVMLVAPLLIYSNRVTYYVSIFIGITTFVFYLYLVVAWVLAIVVSTVEENCYGMEALGKSAQLVKGKRLHGFLLNICFNLVVLIIFQSYKIILGNKGFVNPTMYGLFVVNVSSLAQIFLVVSYTVLYFHCKKHHGEEIELKRSFQYTKLPIAQLANDMP